ncbi:lysophospholipid acyltransferase 5 [Euwallacea fornicatus]|uniref:lysophospholipid acyltransferase 5 n=1 Tax=Euwallacea fornicatus TaxID=995702 RepID=UPI00338E65DE
MVNNEIPLGIMDNLAQSFGVTVPALKLLLGIIAGYPFALTYRKYIFNQSEQKQCFYLIACGLTIGFWNYGYGMFHCVLSILVTYAFIHLLKGIVMISVVFAFNFIYLLAGYFYSSTDSYDITWTMPYCILVLKLIGVAFDVYDGARPKEKLSSDALKTALSEPPSLLQMLGHSLFPSACLVGPQFSMRRFLDFTGGKFHFMGPNGEFLPPDSAKWAAVRFCMGVFYVGLFQILSLFVYDDLIISEEFASMSFIKRMLMLGVWGRYIMYKYISCWLLAEGACVLFGISYSGEDGGVKKWDGVENIKLSVFENSTEFNHYIMSFNVNTNQWVAQHIYKRLKFLGNRYYSQGGVLLFLAVWHGLHTGYYLTFLHEFIVIYTERDLQSIIKSSETLTAFFGHPVVKSGMHILLRLYTFVFMGWFLLPFTYLQFPKYWRAFSNCSYIGFLVFYLWPVLYRPILRKVIKKKKSA